MKVEKMFACVGVLTMLAGCTMPVSRSDRNFRMHKTVMSGRPLALGSWTNMHADCTTDVLPTVTVQSSPAHGSLQIETGMDYPSYASNNQRYECNKQKHPAVIVTYVSLTGYVGSDSFTLRGVFADGTTSVGRYDISVEASPNVAATAAH